MADYSDGKFEAILNLRRNMEKRMLKYHAVEWKSQKLTILLEKIQADNLQL